MDEPQYPDSVVPSEVVNTTRSLHGPETIEKNEYRQEPGAKSLICRLGGGAIEWDEKYRRIHYCQTAHEMGGFTEGTTIEEIFRLVKRMPKPPLDLPTIIRAGVENEIKQCHQPDFCKRLQASHEKNADTADQLLKTRRRVVRFF